MRDIQNVFFLFLFLFFLGKVSLSAQIPSPSEVFGFEPGADYELAGYDRMLEFYEKLASGSDRVEKFEIGKTTQGRPMLLLVISSKENLARLEEWKTTSQKLAKARIDSAEAAQLSKNGKAIVWIDAGMHANELAPAQMSPLLAYRVATEDSPQMQKIRENVVLLLMPVMNPDGLAMWRSWYYRHLNTPYETSQVPWLWQEFVGHDNNRDWFMGNMQETRNVMKVLYEEWFPQIVYNHHQPAQKKAWERIFIPPFRSPVNPRIHPGVTAGVNEVGSAMLRHFSEKQMPGVLSGYVYSMYWNGGMRTVPYYHNMIGLLSETVHGTPTPTYYDPTKKPKAIPGTTITTDGTNIHYPYPWEGGWSHFRDAVDYAYTASIGVLEHAADRRQQLLKGIYTMGASAIHTENKEAPFAYVLPKNQWDAQGADNLVRILLRGGVEVHQATKPFKLGNKNYPKGTYLVYSSQAFRPYVLDLLETQEYPEQFEYPGGPPKVPYDLAGWTLPMQMGLTLDRINEVFEVEAELLSGPEAVVSKGELIGKGENGFVLNPNTNGSVKAVNRLLKANATVYRLPEGMTVGKKHYPAGSFLVEGIAREKLEKLSQELGIAMTAVASSTDKKIELNRPKIGIYKSWIANMDEGWTRWLLEEEYGFELDTLHDKAIRNEDLSSYTSIVLPSQNPASVLHGHSPLQMPEEYTGGIGLKGIQQLADYVEKGGTLIAFDAASDLLIEQLGLPLKNAVKNLDSHDFFIPGSLVKVGIDTHHQLAWGMQDTIAASFQRSRAFSINKTSLLSHDGYPSEDPSLIPNVEVIARYAPQEKELLMSGWMQGGKHIAGKPALVRLDYGKGQLILFAFRSQFRGQTHGSYKLIFNALYQSATK